MIAYTVYFLLRKTKLYVFVIKRSLIYIYATTVLEASAMLNAFERQTIDVVLEAKGEQEVFFESLKFIETLLSYNWIGKFVEIIVMLSPPKRFKEFDGRT